MTSPILGKVLRLGRKILGNKKTVKTAETIAANTKIVPVGRPLQDVKVVKDATTGKELFIRKSSGYTFNNGDYALTHEVSASTKSGKTIKKITHIDVHSGSIIPKSTTTVETKMTNGTTRVARTTTQRGEGKNRLGTSSLTQYETIDKWGFVHPEGRREIYTTGNHPEDATVVFKDRNGNFLSKNPFVGWLNPN